MLLAPNTRWAMVNLAGSVGGKYGAKTHLSPQRRLKILQAAHGLRTKRGESCGRGGEDVGEAETIAAEASHLISISSIIKCVEGEVLFGRYVYI